MTKKITIESLAHMIQKGFEETAKKADVDKRFEKVELGLEGVETKLDHLDIRLYHVEKDLSDIKKQFVLRFEFEDLIDRVRSLEKKLIAKGKK